MQRSNRSSKDLDSETPSGRTRPDSRRSSAGSAISSISRQNSVKTEPVERKKMAVKSPRVSVSSNSTPKRTVQKPNFEFLVTGKPLLRKSDRANSLPGFNRRQSADSLLSMKVGKTYESPKDVATVSVISKSRDSSLDDDVSLDFSLISELEETTHKRGANKKNTVFATSTPKNTPVPQETHTSAGKLKKQPSKILDNITRRTWDCYDQNSTFSISRDSTYKTSSTTSNYRRDRSSELDCSSVSPECSGQSSESSPRTSNQPSDVAVVSPFSQRSLISGSSCYMSWVDSNEDKTKVEEKKTDGEWNTFWANYNNSVSRVPMKRYYDQCPTPYRTEDIDLTDLDITTEDSRRRPPQNLNRVSSIIRNEGLHLTPRETQDIIKCAHILGNVLTKAIDRKAKTTDTEIIPEVEVLKKNMTLELKEQNKPLEVPEEKNNESVMTQTDISLPNTKSAPRIFEKILRQLSKSSLEEQPVIADTQKQEKEKEVEDNYEE